MDDNPALEFNLPWIKPITELINSFNLNCTHQGFCHPACFKRQNRAAKRLTRALREMYGEKVEYIEEMFTNEEDSQEEIKKGKWSKWSESTSTSPDHRRETLNNQNYYERSKDTLLNCEKVKESDNEKKISTEETAIEKDPEFLKYLQLKVPLHCGPLIM